MYEMDKKIAAITPNATKWKWILFHRRASVHTVANSAPLSFPAETRITARPHEDLEAQRLRIKYVYSQVHVTTACRVWNDCKIPKVDEPGALVSTYVHNDAEQYQTTILRNEGDDELPI